MPTQSDFLNPDKCHKRDAKSVAANANEVV